MILNRPGLRVLYRGLSLALALLLASCSTGRDVHGTRSFEAAKLPPPEPQPYTRIFRPDTNTLALQIAVRKFVPARGRGPVLWLAGASHVGDPDYYANLQRHLDAQTLVLFEGINAGAHPRRTRGPRRGSPPATPPGDAPAAQPGLQTTLAASLGLVFQLNAVDYDRTNFLNSDLSVGEIQGLLTEDRPAASTPGKARTGGASFESLLQAMDGSSFLGGLLRLLMNLISSNSKLQALTKLAFIEALGQLKGDLAAMRGLPPDMHKLLRVLIAARNEHVLDDFQAETRSLPRASSVAIFYGTGHMDDMEKRVTRELGYQPAGDLWLTAFSVNLPAAGISEGELKMVESLVRSQMGQSQP